MGEENEKSKTVPVKMIRQGAIGASIWERSGKKGTFYEFSLSRSYKGADGKSGYAQTYHSYDVEAIRWVVEQASSWIRGRESQIPREEVAT